MKPLNELVNSERTILVRQTTKLLYASQIALLSAIGIFAAFGTIVIFDLSGRQSLSPILLGIYNMGAATGAFTGGRIMGRYGRRTGLLAGYGVMVLGSTLILVSALSEFVLGVLLSAAILGAGGGAALLARTAIADMNRPEERGKAVGNLVLIGTIGAVGGPPIASMLQSILTANGWVSPAGVPWIMIIFLALTALFLISRIKVDPQDLAFKAETTDKTAGIMTQTAAETDAETGSITRTARAPRKILMIQPALLALAMISISQTIMIIFMGAIPANIHQHGAAQATVSLVVSLHLAGMFAFSRFFGQAMDRWGRRLGLHAGAIFSATGLLIALLIPGTVSSAIGLFFIGVGWSAAFIGSTTIFSDVTTVAERAQVLGAADLVVAISSATGIFSGAILLEFTSFTMVALVSLTILTALSLFLFRIKEIEPGKWRNI